MSIEFDIGPLSWVKDEIDQALQQALAKAADFAAAPHDSSPLRFCLTHVHQVGGALAMVGLDGAHRVSTEIERYIDALEKQAIAPDPNRLDLLARALQALLGHVRALVGGTAEPPLQLFPEFEAMQRALGETSIQRSELFFPDLFNSAPSGLETFVPADVDPAAYLHDLAQQYRRHLLQWLRAPQDEAQLLGMRDALQAVERAQALPAQKTLWWAAVGLLEALAQGALAADKHVRQLCAQLERQLNYLVRGDARPNSRLLREVLYHVGTSAPVTQRIRDVKRVFDLDRQFPSAEVPPAGQRAAAALDDAFLGYLSEGLGALKGYWAEVAAGERGRLADILRLNEALCAQAEHSGQDALRRALADVGACAALLAQSGDAVDPLFPIEMAATLLMLESALGVSGKALESALQGAAAQAAATRAMLPGAESAPPAPAALAAGQGETLAVLARVADEIRANLQRVEQMLDDFFRDPEARAELLTLSDLFRQVAGAFRMLEQPVAADVVAACQALVERFAQPAAQVGIEEYELVAESLSALGFYLDRLLRGDAEASRAIAQLPSQLQAALEAAPAKLSAPPHAPNLTAPGPAEVQDSALDEELLAVYLAEAGEVHETIVSCLQALRAEPGNHEALVTLRRAFHTLKGSGRTVGLQAMGEVAWAVEQLLNHLLEQRSGVDAQVLDFVDSASARFQEWVKALFVNGTVTLAPCVWKTAAEALLRQPAQPEPAPAAPATTTAAPPAAAAGDDAGMVVIGGAHAVNRELFEIFLEEAGTNLDLLQRTYAAARVGGEPPIPDPARAAHTLGGVARTVRLLAVADLGSALEAWLERTSPRLARLAPDELHLFDQALVALQAMLRKAENRRRPAAATWLCDALRGDLSPPAGGPQAAAAAAPAGDAMPDAAAGIAPAQPAAREQDNVPSFVPATNADNIDQQLLEVFLEEANELMPLVGRQLREWQADPAGSEAQQALQRALHTLKGSARMAGALKLGDALHELETRVLKALEKGTPTARSFAVFFKQYDSVSDQLDALRGHAEAPAAAAFDAPQGGRESF